MATNLPKVHRNVDREQRIVYMLAGVIAVLIVIVAGLLLAGDLFSNEPTSALDRDYQLLLQGLERYPEDPTVLMTLAETEHSLGKTGDALEHAALAYEFGFEMVGIPRRYAQILVLEGETEQALVAIEQELALASDMNNPEAMFLYAQIKRELGDLDEAIETMSLALDLAYTAADMRVVYAGMLAEAGRTDEAILHYEEALRYLPDSEEAIAGLAELGVEYEATSTVSPHDTTSSGDDAASGTE